MNSEDSSKRSGKMWLGILAFLIIIAIFWRIETLRHSLSSNRTASIPKSEDARKSFERSKGSLEEGNITESRDFAIHGMRISPSTESFNATIDLVERAMNLEAFPNDIELQDYTFDLTGRAEAMISYIDLKEVSKARQTIDALRHSITQTQEAKLFPNLATANTTESSVPPEGEGSNLESWITLAEQESTPLQAKFILLQQARAFWESEILSREILPADSSTPTFWDEWTETGKRIDAADNAALVENFSTVLEPKFEAWGNSVEGRLSAWRAPVNISNYKSLMTHSDFARSSLSEAARWSKEFVPYIELKESVTATGSESSAYDSLQIPQPAQIAQNIRWSYSNKLAINWLRMIEEIELVEYTGKIPGLKDKNSAKQSLAISAIREILTSVKGRTEIDRELSAASLKFIDECLADGDEKASNSFIKLVLLLAIDTRMTTPYVHDQYEITWTRLEGDLDENGKLVSAKLRTWKERR